MNIQQLEYFVNLAQTEHMTKSAKLLNTSQPSLSYAIHELERELGVPLFEKVGRNIQLTKYGKAYHSFALSALNQLHSGNDFIKNIIDPYKGQIEFGFIYTMGSEVAPQMTKDFLQTYPEVTFHFKQSNTKELLDDLIDGKLDIALVSSLEGYEQLDFTPIIEEELVVIVPQNHPLAQQDAVSLKDISQENLVYFEGKSGLRHYLDQLFDSLDLSIKPTVEVEEDHTILGFVAQEYGIAIIPNIPSISAYKVKKLKIKDDFQPRQIFLATRKENFIPPIVASFKEFCLQKLVQEKK